MDSKQISNKLRLNIFRLQQTRQDKVYDQIKENAKGDLDFYLLNLFSSIIITLGLIIDSGAVVIGGMLIAPLVWPIFLMSLAILMGRGRILERALFTFAKATLIIFLVAVVIGFFAPDVLAHSQQILSRTNPTIFELAIALASGFVGAFIVAYPKLGSAMAGVVVAAALVPPLAVTGLAISQNDMTAAGGSLLLFLSNLVAITFASGALFLLARFRGPSTTEGKEVRRVNIRWFIILFIAVLVPLTLITSQTLQKEKRNRIVESVLLSELKDVKVTEMNISEANGIVVVDVILRSPDSITKWQVTKLTDILSRSFKQSVVLKIEVIPIVEAGKLLPQLHSSNNSTSTSASGQ